MRKLLGRLRGVAGLLLRAVPLFLLLLTTFCRAQTDCPAPTITSIIPDTWYAGMTNNFVITGTNLASGLIDSAGIGFCNYEISLTTADGKNVATTIWNEPSQAYSVLEWIGGKWVQVQLVGETTTQPGTIEPDANVPTGTATYTMENTCEPDIDQPCPNGYGVVWKVSFPVQIACPIPSISTVTPDLAPGESVSTGSRISTLYDFTKPGQYMVQLSRYIGKGEKEGTVKSNIITITVVAPPPPASASQ